MSCAPRTMSTQGRVQPIYAKTKQCDQCSVIYQIQQPEERVLMGTMTMEEYNRRYYYPPLPEYYSP